MRSMILVASAALALSGAAYAQAPASTTTKTTAAHTATTRTTAAGKPRTAASIACSGQADAKGVHGKDRNKFMSACKKAAKTGK